jgi:hypothetical protein
VLQGQQGTQNKQESKTHRAIFGVQTSSPWARATSCRRLLLPLPQGPISSTPLLLLPPAPLPLPLPPRAFLRSGLEGLVPPLLGAGWSVEDRARSRAVMRSSAWGFDGWVS